MLNVKIHKTSFEAGYQSGYENGCVMPQPVEFDGYSWSSGQVEGIGDRQMKKPSLMTRQNGVK